jgi:hypothetical protein
MVACRNIEIPLPCAFLRALFAASTRRAPSQAPPEFGLGILIKNAFIAKSKLAVSSLYFN